MATFVPYLCYPARISSTEPDSDYDDCDESGGEINIGLVGEAGSGKSSFVNAIIRNNEATETSVTSPTCEPKSYPHPKNPNVKLWDLPGLGTAAYPNTKTYYEKLRLEDQYHAFLLFTRGRLTSNSQRLAIRLESTKKPFLFIRTCVDVDVNNEKTTKPETFNEAKMVDEIRQNILKGLKDLDSVSGEEIFLISNVQPKKWDFGRLNDEILYELPIRDHESSMCMSIGFSARRKLEKLSLTEKREKLKTDNGTSLEFMKAYMPEETRDINKEGIGRAQNLMKEELEGWKNIKISLAIIGISGVGKSSFINAIRGITKYNVSNAAKTGPVETTMTPKEFHYPDNPKITLWDCPGIGTNAFPDIKTYCHKVDIEKYDAFIIMTATRFNDQAGDLAKKLTSINKPFFFARTKIDQDYVSESVTKRSDFNEVTMLNEIKEDCSKNLKLREVELDDNDIFLISNLYLYHWDFARLTEAINNRLHSRKRECFLFSMLSLSENILEGKVQTLKGRVKFVAFFQSMIMKPFTTTKYSRKKDFELIVTKVEFYRSQLGFPKQDTEEFQMMSDGLQNKVRRFYLTSEIDVELWLREFDTAVDEEGTEYGDENTECADEDEDCGAEEESLSWLEIREAIKAPYTFVYNSLHDVLDEMKEIALEILKETAARSQPDFH